MGIWIFPATLAIKPDGNRSGYGRTVTKIIVIRLLSITTKGLPNAMAHEPAHRDRNRLLGSNQMSGSEFREIEGLLS
jgi:hypothetical protein